MMPNCLILSASLKIDGSENDFLGWLGFGKMEEISNDTICFWLSMTFSGLLLVAVLSLVAACSLTCSRHSSLADVFDTAILVMVEISSFFACFVACFRRPSSVDVLGAMLLLNGKEICSVKLSLKLLLGDVTQPGLFS